MSVVGSSVGRGVLLVVGSMVLLVVLSAVVLLEVVLLEVVVVEVLEVRAKV